MPLIGNSLPAGPIREKREHRRDCPDLVLQLEDPNPVARRWAARDLMDCAQASGALVSRLSRELDPSVREVILTSLTSLGDAAAVAGLVGCLRSEDAGLRNEAIEAMKQLPDAVAPIMGGLLGDPSSDVRIFAVNVLESLRHPDVESWLIRVIDLDTHLNVCATAVDLLGEVGSSLSRDALLRLEARYPDEPYIQFAARLALKRIANEPPSAQKPSVVIKPGA
jgi:HEAT repeat protein